jgi:hypothetical protein
MLSFDGDFDRTDRRRQTPVDVVEEKKQRDRK